MPSPRRKAPTSIAKASKQAGLQGADRTEPKERFILPRLALQRRERGRDDAFSDEVVALLSDMLAESVPLIRAAEGLGLNAKQIGSAMARGRRDIADGIDSRFARLVLNVSAAEVEHDVYLLRCLKDAPPGEWQKFAWLLERTRREHYALKRDSDGGDGGALGALQKIFEARVVRHEHNQIVEAKALEEPKGGSDGDARDSIDSAP